MGEIHKMAQNGGVFLMVKDLSKRFCPKCGHSRLSHTAVQCWETGCRCDWGPSKCTKKTPGKAKEWQKITNKKVK